MLGTLNPRHERVQEELVTAEIEVAPGSLAVIVLGTF
jgi:hypothetical protein